MSCFCKRACDRATDQVNNQPTNQPTERVFPKTLLFTRRFNTAPKIAINRCGVIEWFCGRHSMWKLGWTTSTSPEREIPGSGPEAGHSHKVSVIPFLLGRMSELVSGHGPLIQDSQSPAARTSGFAAERQGEGGANKSEGLKTAAISLLSSSVSWEWSVIMTTVLAGPSSHSISNVFSPTY